MSKIKSKHTSEFKFKVVLETLKGTKTLDQIAKEFFIHPTTLSEWKKQFSDSAIQIFTKQKRSKEDSKEKAKLLKQIDRLEMDIKRLKKKLKISGIQNLDQGKN